MPIQVRDIKDIPESNNSILQEKSELYNINYGINEKGT